MFLKRSLLSLAVAFILTGPVFADGGPVAEPAPPPPPPPPPAEEPAPPPPPPPAAPAFEPGFYVEAEGGVTFSGDLQYGCCELEMETGFNFGGAIGVHMTPNWDVEIEAFYPEMGYEGFKTSLDGLGIMANLVYGFDSGMFVDPYVGVGLGSIRVHYDGEDQFPAFTGSDWKFGYQAMAGLMMDLSPSLGIFAEYRFHDAVGGAVIEGVGNIEYHSHNASVGIQLSF